MRLGGGLILAVFVAIGGCRRRTSEPEPNEPVIELNGAGATFPLPLYSKWLAEYQKVRPAVWLDYKAVGSSEGITLLSRRMVDFAGSEEPLSDREVAEMPFPIVHVPTALGAVVI